MTFKPLGHKHVISSIIDHKFGQAKLNYIGLVSGSISSTPAASINDV